MPIVLDGPALGKTLLQTKPIREFTIAQNGALLTCGWPRYATMDEYVTQFAAPLSSLPAHGLYTFYDPINPQVNIVVEGELQPTCERCSAVLDDCARAF